MGNKSRKSTGHRQVKKARQHLAHVSASCFLLLLLLLLLFSLFFFFFQHTMYYFFFYVCVCVCVLRAGFCCCCSSWRSQIRSFSTRFLFPNPPAEYERAKEHRLSLAVEQCVGWSFHIGCVLLVFVFGFFSVFFYFVHISPSCSMQPRICYLPV